MNQSLSCADFVFVVMVEVIVCRFPVDVDVEFCGKLNMDVHRKR